MSRLTTAYSRLISQFKNKPKWVSFLSVFFAQMSDTDLVLVDLASKRWIDTAEGVWLDICGLIVGVPRPGAFESDDNIFTNKDIGGSDTPSKAYANNPPTTGGHYQDYFGGLTIAGELMDDDSYRKYIKAKAKATKLLGTLKNITKFCKDVFELEVDASSPITGLVVVTPRVAIGSEDKHMIERLAPLIAGVRIRCDYGPIL